MNEGRVAELGWTLLHFLWQGTAIAAIYAALRALLRRSLSAQGRYLLACLTLATMVAAPVITYVALPRGSATGTLVSPFIPWTLPAETWQRLLPIFVALWMTGVAAFSIRVLGGWRMVARLRRASHPAEVSWQRKLDEIAAKVKTSRPVRLLVSPLVDVPTVIGWLRPVILVPLGTLTGLPAEHVHALLAHELAHIRRYDYLAGMLQNIAETVLFYHPAVWWVSKEIREERELCCDDVAVAVSGDVLVYARALAQLESIQTPRMEPALAANGGSLFHRIRRLIEPGEIAAGHLPGPGATGAMTLLWLAGIGIATLHATQSTEPLKQIVQAARALVAATAQTAPQAARPVAEIARASLMFDPLLPGRTKADKPAAPRREWTAAAIPSVIGERKTIAAPFTDDRSIQTIASMSPLPDSPMKDLEAETLAILAAVRTAQSERAEASVGTESIIRSTTNMVQVEVRVRGRGNPITDLQQSDFRLFDNGREQSINAFSFTSARNAAPAATVIFIDRTDADPLRELSARHDVVEVVRKLPANEPLAICVLDTYFRVISDAGDTPERRAKALMELWPVSGAPVADESTKLRVLDVIGRQLGKLPGRKNLLWIGSNFTMPTEGENSMLHAHAVRTLHALNVANVALFPIAMEGLLTPKVYRSYAPVVLRTFPSPLEGMRSGFDLREWAEKTDGYASFNMNLRNALEKVFDEERGSYTLGFYPEDLDGEYHDLRVTTGRRNVEVRSRQGYLAVAPAEAWASGSGKRSNVSVAMNVVPAR